MGLLILSIIGCKGESRKEQEIKAGEAEIEASEVDGMLLENTKTISLDLEQAEKLAELPLGCINREFPNKLGQTLAGKEDIKTPRELHPAFYGCFDWHSSVHGHWSLVRILKDFAELKQAEEIRKMLRTSLSKENIAGEIAYFQKEQNLTYERTYGWAWLLKLSEELYTWDSETGRELYANLQPLAKIIETRFMEFLPRLNYPIRVGEHTNTAFALSFAYDYAVTTKNEEFKTLIENRAKDFYLNDHDCPLSWEPSGFDFLSPCLQEVDVMRKILPKSAFILWTDSFMPELKNTGFVIEAGVVSDRTDGKLVHLDGLNLSRAWVLYGLVNQYPENYSHLKVLADNHMAHTFDDIFEDSYEGGHWLGSFALYALKEAKQIK